MKKIDTSTMSDAHPAILRLANAINDAIDAGGDVDIDLGALDPRPKPAHIEVVKLKLDRLGLWHNVTGGVLRVAESAPVEENESSDVNDNPDPAPVDDEDVSGQD